jgi:hypothetical protein
LKRGRCADCTPARLSDRLPRACAAAGFPLSTVGSLLSYPPRVVPGRDDILEPAPDRTSTERDRTRIAVSKHGYKFLLVAVGLLFIGISALVAVGCLSDHLSSLSLSKLESQAQQSTIARVVINGTTADVTDSHGRRWQTELPTDSGAVAEKLTMAGVDVTYGQARGGTSLALSLLPSVLLVGLLGAGFFFMRRTNQARHAAHVVRPVESSPGHGAACRRHVQ